MSQWDNDPAEDFEIEANERRRRGRPATGQNTKVIRVPLDFDRDMAIRMYYEWLPIIREYADYGATRKDAIRWERLVKLMEELGEL